MSAAALAGFAAAVLMTSLQAHADVFWSTSAGDWSVPSNWGGTIPTSGDNAWVVNGGTATITQSGEACGALTLGNSAGRGAVQMGNGSLSLYNGLILGNDPGSNGAYVLSGNGQLSLVEVPGASWEEIVGNCGTGNFVQLGGTNQFNYGGGLVLGWQVGSSGTYSLSGNAAITENPTEYIGYSGSGSFVQSGGSNCGSITIGLNTGVSGTYLLQGNGLLSGYVWVGVGGSGSFTQTSGTVSGGIELAGNSGGTGIYSLSGSHSLLTGGETIGAEGIGIFTQTGGTNAASGLTIGVGDFPLSWGTGTYNLTSGYLSCGPYPFYLGNGLGGNGTFSLSGGQMSAGAEYVGNVAMGTFTQTGGTNSASGGLYIYSGTNSFHWTYTGTYNLDGGLLSINALYPVPGRATASSTSTVERFRPAAVFRPECQ